MPITVTAPRGVLTPAGEREILPRLSAALLAASGATGNAFFTGIVGGTVQILDADRIYGGGVNRPLVMVELKLPGVALPDPASRAAFIVAATDTVDALTTADHDRANTWVNILTAPDGGWGIAGTPYTNDALLTAATPT